MADHEPVAAQPFSADDARPLATWPEARRRLEEADTYWLATVRADGRPHVVPVLAVWLARCTSARARPPARGGTSRATRTA
jgi:hypothetical protein